MSKKFFTDLPGFTSFEDACNPKNYHPAPADWYVVLTDVQGSTKAIEEGRYKDVNMVGAACITAAVNVCKDVDIPYVFGGDGATFLVPPEYIEQVKQELLSVKYVSHKMHDLMLRVGAVPIEEIINQNKRLNVAKFLMPTGCPLAMFDGGGASLADDLVKNETRFQYEDNDLKTEPDLSGLSCRWQPIPARRGTMLTLLVMAVHPGSENEIYSDINHFIAKTLDANASPVHEDNLTYKWPTPEAMRQSQMVWKQGNIFKNLLETMFLIVLFNVLNRFQIRFKKLDVVEYKKDMIINSDYRKFDDMLRMVVDCTTEQVKLIEEYLAQEHAQHKIVYGTHYSDTALMTCFVQTLEKENHVHFIDGNNGGYALAAKGLKDQIKAYRSAESSAA